MKISFIKYDKDKESYKIAKGLGMDVFEIDNPDKIDEKIDELKANNYTTIFIPNDLASFSEKMQKRYKNDGRVSIIITPTKMYNLENSGKNDNNE